MVRLWSSLLGIGGALIVLSLVIVSSRVGLAQDASPAAGGVAHPAHIHEGTCDELDPAPRFPLADVTGGVSSEDTGDGSPIGVETSTTTVDVPLAELAGGGYAINVHQSTAHIETYIACGDLGGSVAAGPGADAGDQLAIGLRERSGSGYSGVAVLTATGDKTEVTLYLAQGLAGNAEGASEATPADGGAASSVSVDIKDFAYNPDPITVPVGGRVTWTNQDTVPHTATAQDRTVLQSGALKQGESYTETFKVAGTYEYFCEFHANMKGTVIVQ